MTKKNLIILLTILLSLYILISHALTYIYLCPYTNTSGFKYVAKPIKGIYNATKQVEKYMKEDSLDIKFIYQNAYGSGFIKNNPIPNDLDYILGVHLGEYEYDGSNSDEIARSLTEKIISIESILLLHIKNSSNNKFYPIKHYLPSDKNYYNNIFSCIKNYLILASSGKSYVKNSNKIVNYQNKNIEINVPYMMNANEILLDNYTPLTILTKNIIYNNSSLNYLRELMIVMEYSFTLKHNGIKKEISIIPEAAFGTRLSLNRKLYVSNTFIGVSSLSFIKNYSAIQDKEKYFYYRMLSYRRHLQEAENILISKKNPVKLLKRIVQISDSIAPLLDKDLYQEIGQFVNSTLSRDEIRILNEISNLIHIFHLIYKNEYLYKSLINTPELDELYIEFEDIIKYLKNIDFDNDFIKTLENYKNNYLTAILENRNINNELLNKTKKDLNLKINEISYSLIDLSKLNKYMQSFTNISKQAGYHKVEAYWINPETIGIIINDYTKSINDLKKMARDNNLPNVNYKLITPNSINMTQLRHVFWVRYNLTNEEVIYYNNLKEAMIMDITNFKPKFKVEFTF